MTQDRLNAVVLMNTHKDILGVWYFKNLPDNLISTSSVQKITIMLFK